MIKYSDEQQAIIEAPYMPGTLRHVLAYSGCGKSTTLIGYANSPERISKRALYLCFNRSVALEAKSKFPRHVDCLTMHGLAYRAFGVHYKDRLATKISGADFRDCLSALTSSDESLQVLSFLAFKTLEKWFNSEIGSLCYECLTPDVNTAASMAGINHETVLDGASLILDAMVNGEHPVSHSLYLKLFQLSEPVLPYDVIMVDEAQDLNPVVMDILAKQPAEVIKVGDPHQAIYAFRDAVNALSRTDIETFYLTATYRFGPNLAELASTVLKGWKGASKPLVGKGKDVLINDYESKMPSIPLFINRTKAGLLEVLIDGLLNSEKKVMLPGGKDGYGLSELNDAYSLFKKGEGRGAYSQFESWGQFVDYADVTGCQNASTTVKVIERYKGAVPACNALLSERTTSSIKKADMVVTTAHKSKGLEHPFVILGNDFPDIRSDRIDTLDEQEINLMYVAMTRAEEALHLSHPFRSLIETA